MMEFKYQEALKVIDKVLSNLPSINQGNEMDMTDLDLDHDGYEYELQTIKELVDKETPIKPIDINGGKYCRKCKQGLIINSFKLNSCHNLDCRQVVDWSDSDDN